ncbi:MAG: response regulator [Natronincolaceae bacterium]|jgi:CheY-like chemotaxis protein|nr:response regulator [Bacillota bacterium]NLK91361.1 response regulator [Clostridiales bacterium]
MVIVIDDNKDLADIICRLLSTMGYDATAASNGKEGIAKAKMQKPKVILCDIGMPDMNGYDVARYVRRDDELKDVYLVAISGYSSQKDIECSMEAGFDKHLSKPVNLDVLRTTLESVYESN